MMSMMMVDQRLLDTIRVMDVTRYLGQKGWRRREAFPRHELLVFDGPLDDAGEPIVATLPASDQFKDFQPGLVNLLRLLSQLEERPPAEIADELVTLRGERLGALPPVVDGWSRAPKTEGCGVEPLVLTARDASADRELRGIVVRLERAETAGGEILLRFEMGGRRQHARVQLEAADYRRACDAHRDGQGVRVRGYLEREGKEWRLMSPSDFQVGA
ncbi:MAG TPA: hypothetical protein VH877_17320 [Polyangia bacterium]|jgi:hypothetical protein|nr:hypothetical protein [Polyangia bacterium]